MRHTMHGVNRWKGWVDPTRPRFTGAFPKIANYNEKFHQISKKACLNFYEQIDEFRSNLN